MKPIYVGLQGSEVAQTFQISWEKPEHARLPQRANGYRSNERKSLGGREAKEQKHSSYRRTNRVIDNNSARSILFRTAKFVPE
ncbi:hypothetical protein [Granulicella sp. dw_53]|uniref:hypothetical protein n=1 Tax=Granulicella sp. dw_53 TaxID=2719792 RepID=UPI001BD2B534|nr:hypothetical protein [Granulicella sp. dw_53]